MDELVKGVLLQCAGEALERVETLGVEYQLIASWDGTEVIRQIFSAGRIFGLRPEEGWEALECMYLVQGTAIWENGRRSVSLGPGDSLSGRPVQEPCILTAVTDLVVLYVCSRPSFHLMSGELANAQGSRGRRGKGRVNRRPLSADSNLRRDGWQGAGP